MKFAIIELKIALTKLVLNFEFHLQDENSTIEIREGVVRQPKNGINVILKKRAQH